MSAPRPGHAGSTDTTPKPRGLKVVLFCGGQGLRIRDYDHRVPKPMVPVGYRPVLWHIMRWYAHYGHRDFILCLGHGADVIKRYFLDYDETVTNDFVLKPQNSSRVGRRQTDGAARHEVDLVTDDTSDWSIGFVDTGTNAQIGERLTAVREYLGDDEWFLANYADGLSDLDLPAMIADTQEKFAQNETAASFMKVRPSQSFHCVETDKQGTVRGLHDVKKQDIWINGGYFCLHRSLFDVLGEGEDLVGDALPRLAFEGRLAAWQHDGFFAAMDTFKEQQHLSSLHQEGNAPWEVWRPEKRQERDRAVAARQSSKPSVAA
ncbi:MAG: sugar phosphate nucleotidyltransferase [Planctomycetota bacterium]